MSEVVEPESAAGSTPARSLSQTDVVVNGIKNMIIRGDLGAGSRLPVELDLAAALGVSRSSLREGVRALALMGVLETRQGDGTYVTSLDASLLLAPMAFLVDLQAPADSVHLAVVRRILEVESAARAARLITDDQIERARAILDDIAPLIDNPSASDHELIMNADIAFHRLISEASGNPALAALIEALANRTARTRLWRGLSENGVLTATHSEHTSILRALASGDSERARLAMTNHLMAVEDFLAEEHPPAPIDL